MAVKSRRMLPVKGGRFRFSAAFEQELEAAIRDEQTKVRKQFGVQPTRSFVINNCVAYALNIHVDEHYDESPDRRKRRAKKK